MSTIQVIVIGGGAAGFFGAITCAEADPRVRVTLLEGTAQFLSKVRISGGGRCNVTHACFQPRELTKRYPRGEKALIGAFQRFNAQNTVEWFINHGVPLKTEPDGRMFPTTDNSQTIVDCLMHTAIEAGVKVHNNRPVQHVERRPEGGFNVTLSNGERMTCDRLLLATGGCRAAASGQIAGSLGHTIVPPVPSLFTFHIESKWLRELPGVSVEEVEASVADTKLRERGPLLVTHWGLSGPAILRLSAWGARELHELNYRFNLLINWLPAMNAESLTAWFQEQRLQHGAKLIINTTRPPLPARLWTQLVRAANIGDGARWASFPREAQLALIRQLTATEFAVSGKSLNKEEFVTCGGVKLDEVNFKTMESRVCPGLHFAGELLDIDGITGGFNFQAAWTTGWLAGKAMAEK